LLDSCYNYLIFISLAFVLIQIVIVIQLLSIASVVITTGAVNLRTTTSSSLTSTTNQFARACWQLCHTNTNKPLQGKYTSQSQWHVC